MLVEFQFSRQQATLVASCQDIVVKGDPPLSLVYPDNKVLVLLVMTAHRVLKLMSLLI